MDIFDTALQIQVPTVHFTFFLHAYGATRQLQRPSPSMQELPANSKPAMSHAKKIARKAGDMTYAYTRKSRD